MDRKEKAWNYWKEQINSMIQRKIGWKIKTVKDLKTAKLMKKDLEPFVKKNWISPIRIEKNENKFDVTISIKDLDNLHKKNKKLIENKLNETSYTGNNGLAVDDGPNFIFSDFKTYDLENTKVGKRLHLTIVNYLLDKNYKTEFPHIPMGNQGKDKKELELDRINFIAKKLGFKILKKYIEKATRNEVSKVIKTYDKVK